MPTAASRKTHVHQVAKSANDKQVYADLISKPLANDVSNNPHLLRLAETVISLCHLEGAKVQLEYDMGHDIGRSDRVITTDMDIVFYARESKTAGYTRFVKNRQSKPTGCITINLIQDDVGNYEVTNIWIGKTYPVTPDHAKAKANSQAYWSRHAVIYNGQPLVASTLTKTCPY
jgi:hypothetical protein